MITNLFSVFDPSTIFNYSLNWIRSFIVFIFIPSIFWILPSRSNFIWIKLINFLHSEINNLLIKKNSPGRTLIFISLFSFIMFNNVLGLFPYIFTRSSHLIFSLSLSLSLWLTIIIYGWLNFRNHIFSHIIPQGTPSILIPFIICIESISNIIRPITLAIRLSANIISGHLLITLLRSTGPSLNFLISLLVICQIMLILLESAVAFIQTYVFTILRTLYAREIN